RSVRGGRAPTRPIRRRSNPDPRGGGAPDRASPDSPGGRPERSAGYAPRWPTRGAALRRGCGGSGGRACPGGGRDASWPWCRLPTPTYGPWCRMSTTSAARPARRAALLLLAVHLVKQIEERQRDRFDSRVGRPDERSERHLRPVVVRTPPLDHPRV